MHSAKKTGRRWLTVGLPRTGVVRPTWGVASCTHSISEYGLIIRCERHPRRVSRSEIRDRPAILNERVQTSRTGGIGRIDGKLRLQLFWRPKLVVNGQRHLLNERPKLVVNGHRQRLVFVSSN